MSSVIIVLFVFGIPLGMGVLIWGMIWFVRQTYYAFCKKHTNAVSRLLKGKERLSVIFWRWGVFGYLVSAFVVTAIQTFEVSILRHGFMSDGRGPDTSLEQLSSWEILACFCVAWCVALFRNIGNVKKTTHRIFAIGAACLVILLIILKIPVAISLHKQIESVEECRRTQHLGEGGILQPVCTDEAIKLCSFGPLCVF